MPSCATHTFLADGSDLKAAVDAYTADTSCADDPNSLCSTEETYGGLINDWCVGAVENMSQLFQQKFNFTGDISGWDVSSVRTMDFMFQEARSFNGDLNDWRVSSVQNMKVVFQQAESFEGGGISSWDVSSVHNFYGMFNVARSFNINLSAWDISSGTSFYAMFYHATSFSQNLCRWADTFMYDFLYSENSDDNVFGASACAFQTNPVEANQGPFCASDCVSCSMTSTFVV